MATGRRVRGAGLSLAVTERGERGRATVVCLHGFPDTGAVWDLVAENLAEDVHVVTYDVRGAGASDTPPTRAGYALPFLVEDLLAVADATSPDAPVHLVGHDWGSVQGWEAVTQGRVAARFASFTSISGLPLDHVGLWARRHRSLHPSALRPALSQAMRSLYIAYFLLPVVPELLARPEPVQRLCAGALHRIERVPTDAGWPAATFGSDFAHGLGLYRANVRGRLRHPQTGCTDVPVQLVVPSQDHYVTSALLNGLEEWTTCLWRRPVDGGHWVIRSDPGAIARSVRELVAYIEEGTEAEGLRRARVV
jgi:pimeloyl-ACP methyl ester carboxylesterase